MYRTIVNRCDRTWPKTFQNGDLSCGKLARKKNGSFQSKAVTRKTRNILDSRKKKKSRVIALMMLKCHFSPRVKVKPRYRGDVLLRGRAWFAFCFLPNEFRDLSFFFFFA